MRLYDCFRLFGNRCSQIELATNALSQGANTPTFNPAHFSVKLAFKRLLERQNLNKMAPAQFLSKRCHNLRIGECLCEPNHSGKIACAESLAVFRNQFCRQCWQNLFSIAGALSLQDFTRNTFSESPVKKRERTVRCLCDMTPRILDQRTDFCQQ